MLICNACIWFCARVEMSNPRLSKANKIALITMPMTRSGTSLPSISPPARQRTHQQLLARESRRDLEAHVRPAGGNPC